MQRPLIFLYSNVGYAKCHSKNLDISSIVQYLPMGPFSSCSMPTGSAKEIESSIAVADSLSGVLLFHFVRIYCRGSEMLEGGRSSEGDLHLSLMGKMAGEKGLTRGEFLAGRLRFQYSTLPLKIHTSAF